MLAKWESAMDKPIKPTIPKLTFQKIDLARTTDLYS